jgi:hypothetical protein
MDVQLAGHWPGFRSVPLLCALFFTGFSGLPSVVLADVLVAPGQIALLTVSISVEGGVEVPQGYRDEVVRWSTKRHFESSVKMEAEKPEQISFSAMAGNEPDAMPAAYSDIIKQVEACGEDQACVMRMAMQMAGSPELKEATESPPRYQQWKAASDNALVSVKASYEDRWHTVFYTGAKEVTDCVLIAPKVSPALTEADPTALATWDQLNRDAVQASGEGFMIETDAQNGTSQLHIVVIAAGSGDEKCTLGIGGNAETQHQSTNVTVIPVGELKGPMALEGSAPGTAVIASGSQLIETRMPVTNVGAGLSTPVVAPLKVKVEWEMKAQ